VEQNIKHKKPYPYFFLSVFLILLFLTTALTGGFFAYRKIMYPMKYTEQVGAAAVEFDVDPVLIMSVINVESRFNPRALSHKGASGLMQLMPMTAVWIADEIGLSFNPEMLFDPQTNIRMGTFYLKHLLDRFGDADTAAAAFNAGETTVSKWLRSPDYSADKKTLQNIPYPETRSYVQKVRRNRTVYERRL
jgi:soluble lytic murein transglycosylase